MLSLMAVLTYLISILVVLICYAIYKIKRKQEYFKDRGMDYEPPTFFFGSSLNNLLTRESLETTLDKLYHKYADKRYVGFYMCMRPTILLKDPKLIEDVLIKQFSHFPDHGVPTDEEVNPLEGHLFNLEGKKWKMLRIKLSPAFTSGKLKWMYDQIYNCGDLLMDYLKTVEETQLEIGDVFARFTTDVIGSCGFGIESTSIKDPDNQFRRMGRQVFRPTGLNMLIFLLPEIFMKLRLKTFPDDINDFFHNITKQTIDHRLKTGAKRNDFVQLFLELKEKGHVDYDPVDVHETEQEIENLDSLEDNGKLEFTDGLLAAQSFVFFISGFETTSSGLSLTSYLIAKDPEIQDKVRQEIKEVKAKYNGITYEALKNMVYLDACLKEGLRLYPPIPTLLRKCRKSFQFDDGTEIESGLDIIVVTKSVHRDAKNFPEPDKFKPERFLTDTPVPGTYLSFGDGPRVCIARRFALLESKLILAKILDNYKISVGSNQEEPLQMDVRSFITRPKDGVWIKLDKIQD